MGSESIPLGCLWKKALGPEPFLPEARSERIPLGMPVGKSGAPSPIFATGEVRKVSFQDVCGNQHWVLNHFCQRRARKGFLSGRLSNRAMGPQPFQPKARSARIPFRTCLGLHRGAGLAKGPGRAAWAREQTWFCVSPEHELGPMIKPATGVSPDPGLGLDSGMASAQSLSPAWARDQARCWFGPWA